MPVTHGVTGSSPVRTAGNQKSQTQTLIGALVQLVRIHACHAWGHGFESRTHRKATQYWVALFFMYIYTIYKEKALYLQKTRMQ